MPANGVSQRLSPRPATVAVHEAHDLRVRRREAGEHARQSALWLVHNLVTDRPGHVRGPVGGACPPPVLEATGYRGEDAGEGLRLVERREDHVDHGHK